MQGTATPLMGEARAERLALTAPALPLQGHARARRTALIVKRAMDVAGAAAGLLAAAPLLAALALAIRLDSPGPVIYASTRVGRYGRLFRFYKFRTMVEGAESRVAELRERNERRGLLFKIADDPRLTRVGRLLRKYSLDELPQLFNVVRGEMSLVGPRPALPSEVAQYPPECLRRLEVPPGVSGLWQVRSRGDSSWERYVALDLEYVERWSLWLDCKILLWTIPAVLRGTGV